MRLTFIRTAVFAVALAGAWRPAAAQTADTITVTPSALSFSYQIGGSIPAEQKVQIKRGTSGPALDFTAAVTGSAPWLIVAPESGKTGTTAGVRVNPASMLAGTYTAAVQISATGVSNPAVVNVTLTIRNPPPVPSALPSSLAFVFRTDDSKGPDPQTVTISSNGEPVSFTASVSGGTWLSASPAFGIAVTGSPVAMTVAVDTTGLVPATYTGKVTLSFPSAATKTMTISVTLTVSPGTAVIDSVWPATAPVGSLDTTVTLRGHHFFSASTVQAGTTPLAATWVSTTVMLAVVPKVLLAAEGALAITITNAPQPASAPATFTVTPPGPVIQSVVNAASFAAGGGANAAIAPGEIISIFGSGLGPGALLPAVPSGNVYPATLGTPATVVEFELTPGTWTAIPIIFAQANQVNAMAPFAMTPAAGLKLRVTYNGLTSAAYTFDAVDAEPGLFTTDSSGRGQSAALNYNETTGTYSLNSASNTAAKGSIVVLYATGGGALTPAPSAEGQVLPVTGAPPRLTSPVSVTVGGDGAAVQSATAVAGSLAGLVQINVKLSSTLKSGKDLPVVVSIAGKASPATATLAVK